MSATAMHAVSEMEKHRLVAYACVSGHRQGVRLRLADAPTEADAERLTHHVLRLWFGEQSCPDCQDISVALQDAPQSTQGAKTGSDMDQAGKTRPGGV